MSKLQWVLLLASSLTVMAGASVTPALAQIGAHFADYPDVWIKLVITLPALFITLASPLTGWLVDRHGRLPVLFFSLALYALAGAAGGLMDSLFGLLATRALLGVAVAGVMACATTLIGDYFSGQARQQFMGLQGSFMALGGVVFLNASGWLALISWRAVFLIYLASLLVAWLAWHTLYEPKKTRSTAPLGDAALIQHFPWRQCVPVYLLGFMAMSLFYLLPAQMPFLLLERFGSNSLETAWVVSASTLSGALAGLAFGRVKNHLSHPGLYALAFSLFGLGYGLVVWAPTYAWLLLAVTISGFGAGLSFPTGNHWLLSFADPAWRGRILGGFASVFFMGQFLSPLLAAPIEDRLGLNGVFWVGSLLALSLSGLLVLVQRARHSE